MLDRVHTCAHTNIYEMRSCYTSQACLKLAILSVGITDVSYHLAQIFGCSSHGNENQIWPCFVYRSLLVSSLFMEESRTQILRPPSRPLICVYPELGNSVPRSASVHSAEANPSVLTVTLVAGLSVLPWSLSSVHTLRAAAGTPP